VDLPLALRAALLHRKRAGWGPEEDPKWAAEFTFPVASGWIAGESLLGVGLVMWENGPELARKLLGR
jgi:hypothetical protein